ncbi:NmrA family NAD(P)-binding protein [Nocardia sp. NEAU-G5]|uniref:NmrA family NAD(P)-binding protein n=1 Tax=Nocardia albiluteola TaxID=2842303 RepID=A0ABS6B3L9_9NOCA|nr:NmrA family NAD(P)-binding protein [Nocardia albiluteola]MBU3063838.1 NmrA family NAD(P)-binding protein [Nocardia albiluteola]
MSPQKELILVTGATGKQGGATTRRLLADGYPVRVLVRDPQAPAARALADLGAQPVVGDLDDPASLDRAVTGVRGVFAVPPAAFGPGGWDVELEASRGAALVEAARRAGVDQIVFTGVASFTGDTNWGSGGKRRIERAVAASGMRYTILRPVRFMENYLAGVVLPLDGFVDGVHRHLFPADRPIQVIAVDDIAAVAAIAFADPEQYTGRTLELAGDAVTPLAAMAAIERATGYPVRYEEITEADAAAIGAQLANTWRLAHNGDGWHADIELIREIHPGLQTLETWLATTGAAALKSLLAEQH